MGDDLRAGRFLSAEQRTDCGLRSLISLGFQLHNSSLPANRIFPTDSEGGRSYCVLIARHTHTACTLLEDNMSDAIQNNPEKVSGNVADMSRNAHEYLDKHHPMQAAATLQSYVQTMLYAEKNHEP